MIKVGIGIINISSDKIADEIANIIIVYDVQAKA